MGNNDDSEYIAELKIMSFIWLSALNQTEIYPNSHWKVVMVLDRWYILSIESSLVSVIYVF